MFLWICSLCNSSSDCVFSMYTFLCVCIYNIYAHICVCVSVCVHTHITLTYYINIHMWVLVFPELMFQVWFKPAHTSHLQILYLPATITWVSNLTINTVKTKIITPLLWDVIFPFKNIRSDQIKSAAQSCLTLFDPMNCSTPGLPVHHQLPELTQTHAHQVSDAIQPSHPLSSPSPPAPNPSQNQSLFQWVNSLHEVAKVLEFQL